MSRYRPSEVSVPGYLEARAEDNALTTAPTGNPGADSAAVANSAASDTNVGGSTEVGIIVGTLIAFALIMFSLYLLYRKKVTKVSVLSGGCGNGKNLQNQQSSTSPAP